MKEGFSIKYGTLGGTLTVIICNISSAELLKIAVSAAIGTAVSFVVSLVLKKIVKVRDGK